MDPLKINYPAGTKPPKDQDSLYQGQSIKKSHRTLNYGNRGMTLEEDINTTNKQYLARDIAVIHKKPTPIQVVSVDYPKRSAAKITEAYYRQASTTDYNGVYKGHYLDFEAKETKNKTNFPLSNFHSHQIKHMAHCLKHGGIVFVIIRFTTREETFVCPAEIIIAWWKKMDQHKKRKSIPYEVLSEASYLVHIGYSPRLDYLKAIDQMIQTDFKEVEINERK